MGTEQIEENKTLFSLAGVVLMGFIITYLDFCIFFPFTCFVRQHLQVRYFTNQLGIQADCYWIYPCIMGPPLALMTKFAVSICQISRRDKRAVITLAMAILLATVAGAFFFPTEFSSVKVK